VLQERRFRPVGADAEVETDVLVSAATNRDLKATVEDGRSWRDLFYRLEVLRVQLLPLCSRGRDVFLLAQHFVERFTARSKKRVTDFSRRPWQSDSAPTLGPTTCASS
jgi:two-component system response regulator HydG